MKIGHSTIPCMRLPALIRGKLILFDLGTLRGQWGMICSLPPFDFGEAVFLNQYHRTIKREGASLLGMSLGADPIFNPNLPKTKALGIPLMVDPLRRLERILGLSGKPSSDRCQSFIIDPGGVIRYHLVHVLNWRGMAFLRETLTHCQELYSEPTQPLKIPLETTNDIIKVTRVDLETTTHVKGV